MRLSRLSLSVPKRCQARRASRITPPFSTAKSPSAKLPVSFSQFMVFSLDICLRLFGGLLLESNRDTQKVEVRPASADDRKPDRRAVDRCAREADLRDAGQAALAGQAADAFAQGIQSLTAAGRSSGAGNGVVGRQRMVPCGQQMRMRARASSASGRRSCGPLSGIIEPCSKPRATLKAKRGLRAVQPGLERVPGLAGLQARAARAARPTGPAAP